LLWSATQRTARRGEACLARSLLHLLFGSFVEDRPERGRVFFGPFDVLFSFHDVVEPDLIFVAPDQLDILTDKNIRGTPAMVVEILSPSTKKRDLGIKRDLYARFGVREYWVIDPEGKDVRKH
jgi:Uma2 family endonuclease